MRIMKIYELLKFGKEWYDHLYYNVVMELVQSVVESFLLFLITRFLYTDCNKFVVLKVKGKHILLYKVPKVFEKI